MFVSVYRGSAAWCTHMELCGTTTEQVPESVLMNTEVRQFYKIEGGRLRITLLHVLDQHGIALYSSIASSISYDDMSSVREKGSSDK